MAQELRVKIDYTPHKFQAELHHEQQFHRFMVLNCHRRWGKTVYSINTLIHAALTFKGNDGRFAYIAPYYKQAKQIAWDYFKKYCYNIPFVQFNESELRIDFPNGARIRLFGADNADALRGIYLDGVVMDEVADMKANVWGEVIRPTLADRHGWAIFIGTPKGIDLFYEIYQKALLDPTWFAKTYRADETGLITEKELEAARKEMTEQQFAQEFLCDFAASTGDTLIPVTLAVEASKRIIHDLDVQGAVKVLGVDVARYGDDRSVIQPVQGLKAYEPMMFSGISNVELAQQVMAKVRSFEPDYIRVDAGRGEGVIDYLRQHGFKCTEVNFGGMPMSNYYVNARAEMWDGVKKWLQAGGAIPEIKELVSELASPTYYFTTSNKLAIESKEQMRERGLRSPDYADALALAVGVPLKVSGLMQNVKNKNSGLQSRNMVNRNSGLQSRR